MHTKRSWGRERLLLGAPCAALLAALALTTVSPAGETVALTPPPAGYAQTVLAANPVGYWRLGEAKGALKAVDATVHHHDGVYHNKPHLGQPGALALDKNTAMGLDGPKSRAYVEIAANKHFSVVTSGKGLTVEVWLRPDVLKFQGENIDPKDPYIHWLGKGETGSFEWGFRFYSHDSDRPNRISAYIWNPDGGEGAGAYFEDELTKKKWIYVVATYDDPKSPNPRVQIYKNGAASGHNASSGTLYKSFNIKPKTGKAPVRLGTRDLAGFLTGGLDEVAIYPYVLTPAEIEQHWLIGSGAKQGK
jgi:hypothetical protein